MMNTSAWLMLCLLLLLVNAVSSLTAKTRNALPKRTTAPPSTHIATAGPKPGLGLTQTLRANANIDRSLLSWNGLNDINNSNTNKILHCERQSLLLGKHKTNNQGSTNVGAITNIVGPRSMVNSMTAEFQETKARSAIKALEWRLIAGCVTFATSYGLSGGSVSKAVNIVSSDFFSKSFTMFLGERLMNKRQVGRKDGSDDVRRSLIKALVWRLFAIANTLTVAIFVAKDIRLASKIAGLDAIVKTGLMFGYERAWAKIQWGKQYGSSIETSPTSLGQPAWTGN